MGYHTGVLLSMELARTRPKQVRRVVLVSIPLLSDEQRAAYTPNREPIDADGEYLAQMWASSKGAQASGQSLERVAQLVAEKQRAGARSWWAGPAIFSYDTRHRLAEVAQPTLVLQPADSLATGTAEAASILPRAERVVLDEFEYGFFDTHPEQISGLVREFLEKPVAVTH